MDVRVRPARQYSADVLACRIYKTGSHNIPRCQSRLVHSPFELRKMFFYGKYGVECGMMIISVKNRSKQKHKQKKEKRRKKKGK